MFYGKTVKRAKMKESYDWGGDWASIPSHAVLETYAQGLRDYQLDPTHGDNAGWLNPIPGFPMGVKLGLEAEIAKRQLFPCSCPSAPIAGADQNTKRKQLFILGVVGIAGLFLGHKLK